MTFWELIRYELAPIPMFMWQYAAVLGLLALILVVTRSMAITPRQTGWMYSVVLGLCGYLISALLHIYLPPPSSAPIRYDLLFLAGMMGGWRGGVLAYVLIYGARLQFAGTVQAVYTAIDMAVVTLGGVLTSRWYARLDMADIQVRQVLWMWATRSLTLVLSGLLLLGLHMLPKDVVLFDLLPYKNSLGSLVRKTLMAGPALLFFGSVFAMFKLDAQDRRRQQREWMASRTDSLTQLPNRRALSEYLSLKFDRTQPKPIALVNLSVANHAQMLLSQGHGWGDEFLKLLFVRVQEESQRGLLKSYEAQVFQFSDMSLVLVLGGVTSPQLEESGLAHALLQALNMKTQETAPTSPPQTVPLLDMTVASCDASCHADAATALRDLGLYLNTQGQEARAVNFLHTSFAQAARREHYVLACVGEWINQHTPPLKYMPKCDLRSREVVGAEALLRLHDADGAPVPPMQVLAVATKHKLLAAFEWCTIERACRDLLTWGRSGQPCALSVNISSASLVNAEFAQRLCDRLDSLGLKRNAIVLELTEHDAVPDVEAVRENARLLHEGGIQLSLDDFGSGYSGLTVLARFQFSELKIDRGMVNLINKPRMLSAIQLALESARRYDATLVAEGVETEVQLAALLQLGVTQGQGYLFSRDISLQDLMAYTAAARAKAALVPA